MFPFPRLPNGSLPNDPEVDMNSPPALRDTPDTTSARQNTAPLPITTVDVVDDAPLQLDTLTPDTSYRVRRDRFAREPVPPLSKGKMSPELQSRFLQWRSRGKGNPMASKPNPRGGRREVPTDTPSPDPPRGCRRGTPWTEPTSTSKGKTPSEPEPPSKEPTSTSQGRKPSDTTESRSLFSGTTGPTKCMARR